MKYIAILFFVAIGLAYYSKSDDLQPSCEQGGTQVQLKQEIND